jgi:hypothetical protein
LILARPLRLTSRHSWRPSALRIAGREGRRCLYFPAAKNERGAMLDALAQGRSIIESPARKLHFYPCCVAHAVTELGHERRIRANAPAAGRPQTADPADGQGGFRVGPTADIDTKEPPLFVKQRLPV